jgi:hypothetical protein
MCLWAILNGFKMLIHYCKYADANYTQKLCHNKQILFRKQKLGLPKYVEKILIYIHMLHI